MASLSFSSPWPARAVKNRLRLAQVHPEYWREAYVTPSMARIPYGPSLDNLLSLLFPAGLESSVHVGFSRFVAAFHWASFWQVVPSVLRSINPFHRSPQLRSIFRHRLLVESSASSRMTASMACARVTCLPVDVCRRLGSRVAAWIVLGRRSRCRSSFPFGEIGS